jgi:hypothetical protein
LGIILLGLATAFIHLYLVADLLVHGMSGTMFILNGLGYIGLLLALFLPLPFLIRLRPLVRIVFILYTLVTIAAWVFVGERTLRAYIDKIIEVALVVLLWIYKPEA